MLPDRLPVPPAAAGAAAACSLPACAAAAGASGHRAAAEAEPDFRVDDAAEVLHWLTRLRDQGTELSLVGPLGDALATRIWSIDAAHRELGLAADHATPALPRLVQGDEATAIGHLDQVRLQFELGQLLLVRGERHQALRARLPQRLWRFQRRACYRLPLAERSAPRLQLRHPALPHMQLALRVVDLSAGGCALALPADLPELQPGSMLHGARLTLDEATAFDLSLRLQHLSSLDGDATLRLGCAFAGLDDAAQRALQRFIDRAQQRRRVLGGS